MLPQYCQSQFRGRERGEGNTQTDKQTQFSKSKVREWTLCSHRDFCLEGLISVFSVAGQPRAAALSAILL